MFLINFVTFADNKMFAVKKKGKKNRHHLTLPLICRLHSYWLVGFPPTEQRRSSSSVLFLTAQLSGLGSSGQSPASSGWKAAPLDLMGRQRSSSDPPNMHPPVPPMRLVSTGGADERISQSIPVCFFSVRRGLTRETLLARVKSALHLDTKYERLWKRH